MMVDLYFGKRDQLGYNMGEVYLWIPNKSVARGGRPPEGNLDGEGYTECSSCGKDFFVIVEVRDDVIVAVRPDSSKPPLIRDPEK
jgi:hypothetical protein